MAPKTDRVSLNGSEDIVNVRQAVRSRAVELGFSLVDQTKIVTAASEIARNTVIYGGGGWAELEILNRGNRKGLQIVFRRSGSGNRRYREGAAGWIHIGQRPRSWAGRRQAAGERLRDLFGPRRRDAHCAHAVEAVSTVSIPVSGADEVGEARRAAANIARSLGFGEEDVGRVTIVVTECANNLWKHAAGGEMLITECELEGQPCVEAIALDRGPGMYDVARCFRGWVLDGWQRWFRTGRDRPAVRMRGFHAPRQRERRSWRGYANAVSSPREAIPLQREVSPCHWRARWCAAMGTLCAGPARACLRC